MATATATQWALRGRGYEFCNCDFGCGCNFGGFPNSKDGSCRALVGMHIAAGHCGDVDLSGVKCAAIVEWPKAIHEGNGKAVFIVDPSTSDAQIEALGQIFGRARRHAVGAARADIQVVGLQKVPITIEGEGLEHVPGRGHRRRSRRHVQESRDRRRASGECRIAGRLHLEARRVRPGHVSRPSAGPPVGDATRRTGFSTSSTGRTR